MLFYVPMQSASPPFNGIELDHSDSGREGCAVSTLTITAEPRHWEGAVKVGVQEACLLALIHRLVLTSTQKKMDQLGPFRYS